VPEGRRWGDEDDVDEGDRRRSGFSEAYRTVCVRLCDGFYWPLSYATTRDHFARDANRCEQACPNRSRMFVHRTSETDPTEMKDLKGEAYAKLKNAFRHQHEYVADCTCQGNPWDEEALARHRAYAAEKERATANAVKPRIQEQPSAKLDATPSRRYSSWRNRNDD